MRTTKDQRRAATLITADIAAMREPSEGELVRIAIRSARNAGTLTVEQAFMALCSVESRERALRASKAA